MTNEKKKQFLTGISFVGFWLIRIIYKASLDVTGKFGGGFNAQSVLFLIFTILVPIAIIAFFIKDKSLSTEAKTVFLIWLIVDPFLYKNAMFVSSAFAALLTVISVFALKSGKIIALIPAYISIAVISVIYPVAIFTFIPMICIAAFADTKKNIIFRAVSAFAIPAVIFTAATVIINAVTNKSQNALYKLKSFAIYRFTDNISLDTIKYNLSELFIFIAAIIVCGIVCKKFLSDKLELTDYIILFTPIIAGLICVIICSADLSNTAFAVFSPLLVLSLFRDKKVGDAIYGFFAKHKVLLLILVLAAIFALSNSYDSQFLSTVATNYM